MLLLPASFMHLHSEGPRNMKSGARGVTLLMAALAALTAVAVAVVSVF